MNDQRQYGMLPPGASRLKRKERESLYPANRPLPPPPPPPRRTTVTASTTVKASVGNRGTEITSSSNKLLAGYMAYEFLTKGTLLGQKLDTARSEPAGRGKLQAVVESTTALKVKESYKEITSQLMMKSEGGAQIPGIVNPAQLARWIQM